MTLNLMLTSKDAVYLSGDFRLSSTRDQSPLPDSFDTQKLIPVIRSRWTALIAYMGVASAPPVISDMGQWIVDQMDSIAFDGSFADLPVRLAGLNTCLEKIRGDRRIAFSGVGFRDQQPFMMLISNFLDLDGKVTDTGAQLRAYIRKPNQPEVRAVGSVRPDVFERVRLERLLQVSSSRRVVPDLTRRAIAEINTSVARRSREGVSPECVTGCILRTGAVAIGAHGIPDNAAYLPNWVRKDLERSGVTELDRTDEANGLPIQWKGMTSKVLNGTTVRVHQIITAGKLSSISITSKQIP